MTALDIYPLSEKPEFAETCAAWSFGEWGCNLRNDSLNQSIARYKERAANTDKIPRTWVGMKGDKIAGMVSLVACDHEDRKDLTPWLASMYVHRTFRRQGCASQLIQHLHKKAKELGFSRLYLFTPDAMALYEKNGWRIIGQVRDPRGIHSHEKLMEISL